MEEQDAMIAEFQSVTNENSERSRFYLESSNWQLDVALGSFYDNAADFGDAEAMPQGASTQSPMDTDMEFQDAKQEFSETTEKKSDPPRGSSRFRSLADYDRVEDQKNDDSDEEGQEYYAGGSEHSGEVIIGPGKKKSGEEIVSRMFKNAKKHRAVPVEEAASSSNQKKGGKYFSGGGYKLGMNDTDHEFVPAAQKPGREDNKLDIVLKLWKDGFTVGDGPLRPYHDEESKVFLGAIAKGEIPQELIRLAKGGEVSLDMEDHKSEEYKMEKKKMKPFTGEGHTLGGVTPEVVSSISLPKPVETTSVDPEVIVNESAPVTTVRVQLGDGSRVTQKFNHSHTVAQVYSFVRERSPGDGKRFVLMTTFPNKELQEDGTTLEEGKLLNAVIVQRFK